eukprot:3066792-Amphidinium_carterae.2
MGFMAPRIVRHANINKIGNKRMVGSTVLVGGIGQGPRHLLAAWEKSIVDHGLHWQSIAADEDSADGTPVTPAKSARSVADLGMHSSGSLSWSAICS